MTPEQIKTNETLRFVLENVPSGRLRILEVGCGGGALAKRLHDLGHEVIALDSSADRIDEAKCLGVDARVASFPDFEDAPFDAVLFTRSLHHIRPLEPALEQAHRLLRASGLLLVEDFAFSDVSEHTAAWFHLLLKLLDTCGVLLQADDSFGRELLRGGGDFSLWREHVHEINTEREMRLAVGGRFEVTRANSAPYLYRYVSEMAQQNERGGQIVSCVLELEGRTGRETERFLLGRRLVARPRVNLRAPY